MGCPDLGLALDGPSPRDVRLLEEVDLVVVMSPQDWKRAGGVVIDWLGGEDGTPVARATGG